MKQIFLHISLTIIALAVTATASPPEPCSGTVLLTGISNFQVRQVDSQTFVEFDFTAAFSAAPSATRAPGTSVAASR